MDRVHLFLFYVLFICAKIFRHLRILVPSFLLKLCYLFVKKLYIDLSLYYYFKDKDDVGLFECFILDNAALDHVAGNTVKDTTRLDRQSFILNIARKNKTLSAQKKESDAIVQQNTTIEKKMIIAEKTIETDQVLTYFSKRIEKINKRLYKRINWLHRVFYLSVYKRDRSFFPKEHLILEKPDLDLIVRMAVEGAGR
ncbi:MAG: hypothetical protein HZC28_11990 [Spirochaetes bacterium]|nr:hypothetical protein [Spirochaetota bacterium]